MRDHAAEIEAVKRDMAEKLDALLSERQVRKTHFFAQV